MEVWLAFTAIAFVATVIPGPAMLLVSAHSVKYGVMNSLKTIIGNITGLAILSSLSVAGLSTLIVYSSIAFTIVKILGAAYLAYLGIKIWRNGIQPVPVSERHSGESGNYLYIQGIAVSVSNPKAIVFTTALFPQFIDPSQSLLFQFTIFLCTFMALSFICLLGCSLLVKKTTAKLAGNVSRYLGRVFGGALVGAAGLLLASSHR
ncbi:LysE family translocator [Aquisalimonas lutea]|uniref:LysE family translocator n=1 Tax=Aquisalimonas lutea TaxID=1327750 RepID=UPI0025B53272|nr:LysE family translocator [Aquisalimonas lutea]MDN3517510.1 LysE family translocator [Aquisalimonas lutea]